MASPVSAAAPEQSAAVQAADPDQTAVGGVVVRLLGGAGSRL